MSAAVGRAQLVNPARDDHSSIKQDSQTLSAPGFRTGAGFRVQLPWGSSRGKNPSNRINILVK